MAVIGKFEKLLQLTKMDRSTSGQQLLALLGIDGTTASGQNSIRKNAFALLRLSRNRAAAATFLCATPPMLKEAVSVLCKQQNDPLLGFLVARLVEHRLGVAVTSGLLLSSTSRNILNRFILPGLKEGSLTSRLSTASVSSLSGALQNVAWSGNQGAEDHAPNGFSSVNVPKPFGLVPSVAGVVLCHLWLQDMHNLKSVLGSGEVSGRLSQLLEANIADDACKMEEEISSTPHPSPPAPMLVVPATYRFTPIPRSGNNSPEQFSSVPEFDSAPVSISREPSVEPAAQGPSERQQVQPTGCPSPGPSVAELKLILALDQFRGIWKYVALFPIRQAYAGKLIGQSDYVKQLLNLTSELDSLGLSDCKLLVLQSVLTLKGKAGSKPGEVDWSPKAFVDWCAKTLALWKSDLSPSSTHTVSTIDDISVAGSSVHDLGASQHSEEEDRDVLLAKSRLSNLNARSILEDDIISRQEEGKTLSIVAALGAVPISTMSKATALYGSTDTEDSPRKGDDISPQRPIVMETTVPTAAKSKFNFSADSSRAKAATLGRQAVPNALDMFEYQPATKSTPRKGGSDVSSAPSALDMFDFQPPRAGKRQEPPVSSTAEDQKKASVSSALDMFDYPAPKVDAPVAAAPSALDMFDPQAVRPKKQLNKALSPAPQSALDMFDHQPARTTSYTPGSVNSRKPPSPAPSALDLFDNQPARLSKVTIPAGKNDKLKELAAISALTVTSPPVSDGNVQDSWSPTTGNEQKVDVELSAPNVDDKVKENGSTDDAKQAVPNGGDTAHCDEIETEKSVAPPMPNVCVEHLTVPRVEDTTEAVVSSIPQSTSGRSPEVNSLAPSAEFADGDTNSKVQDLPERGPASVLTTEPPPDISSSVGPTETESSSGAIVSVERDSVGSAETLPERPVKEERSSPVQELVDGNSDSGLPKAASTRKSRPSYIVTAPAPVGTAEAVDHESVVALLAKKPKRTPRRTSTVPMSESGEPENSEVINALEPTLTQESAQARLGQGFEDTDSKNSRTSPVVAPPVKSEKDSLPPAPESKPAAAESGKPKSSMPAVAAEGIPDQSSADPQPVRSLAAPAPESVSATKPVAVETVLPADSKLPAPVVEAPAKAPKSESKAKVPPTAAAATNASRPGSHVETSKSAHKPPLKAKKSYLDQVTEFYQKYNPTKLSSVGEIMAKYKGNEEELLQRLHRQYNVPYDS
jgi:hypothetical protein